MVPAPPHHQCLLHAKETYAAVFGAEANLIPATSGLLIGVTVLAYVGADRFDGLWFFDLHGAAAPAPASKEIAVVLPLDGPLVIDGMGDYRRKGEDKVLREGWASKRGPQFVQWLVETRNG
jgi:hypothetical protein